MKRLNTMIRAFILCCLLLPLSFRIVAQECMNDWNNKVPITIDNTAGEALSDYQIKLTLDTETPILAGQMEADGSDIRFTSDACCEAICYYIESGINTASTVIWVNVPEIEAESAETINMFFGNPDADAASDAYCTFDFWTGFDELTGMEWLCGSFTDTTVSDGNVNLSWSSNGLLGSVETFPSDELYTLEAWVNSTTGTWPGIFWAKSVSRKNYGLVTNGSHARISRTNSGINWCSGHLWASSLVPYSDPEGLWSFTWIETGNLIADFPTEGEITTSNSVYAKDEDLKVMIGGISSGSGGINVDWVRVRKYTAIPPTFSLEIPEPFEPGPLLDLEDEASECSQTTLDAGEGYVAYEWSSGGTEQTETVDETDAYYITVTDSAGCRQTDTIDVTIAPDYSLTESIAVCPGESYTFPDGTVYDEIEEMVVYTSELETAEFGCDSIIETIVNVYEYGLVLDLGEDISSCDDTVFVDAGEGFAAYVWSDDAMTQVDTILTSGTYSVTVVDDNGCEQTDAIEVTITVIDNGVTLDGITLSADDVAGTSYQWLNCDDDYSEIDGATEISFEPAFNGSFAVQITKGECADTSECINTNRLSIPQNEATANFTLYPNPTTGQVYLTVETVYESVVIRITNAEGKLIQEIVNTQPNFTIDLEGESGLYFVEVIGADETHVVRVVKK